MRARAGKRVCIGANHLYNSSEISIELFISRDYLAKKIFYANAQGTRSAISI